jgi:hypothetical protein
MTIEGGRIQRMSLFAFPAMIFVTATGGTINNFDSFGTKWAALICALFSLFLST